MRDASYWINRLGLIKHTEGGYFKETYRSDETIKTGALPERFSAGRAISTAIYYLLQGDDFSAFHRIKSDEIWHYYFGSSLTIHILNPEKGYSMINLGCESERPEFQAVIPHGCWFGATVDDPGSFSLVGCTVSPGFDFIDFELAERNKLLEQFPEQKSIIERLTR